MLTLVLPLSSTWRLFSFNHLRKSAGYSFKVFLPASGFELAPPYGLDLLKFKCRLILSLLLPLRSLGGCGD